MKDGLLPIAGENGLVLEIEPEYNRLQAIIDGPGAVKRSSAAALAQIEAAAGARLILCR
jgi:hypothetical protein